MPPTRSAPLPLPLRLVLVLLAIGAPAAAIDDETTAATPTPSADARPSVTGGAVEKHRAQEESSLEETAAPDERDSHAFDVRIYWERGLNYRFRQRVRLGGVVTESTFFEEDATLNGRIGLKLGVDVAGYLPRGSVPHLGTRFDLRRALFYTTGEFNFLVPILFKVDLGGVGDELYVSDVYLWAQDVPYVGTIKFGQFDAPMSLEALTGSTNETFMEYGSPVEAFAPGLKIGLQIADHARDGRATWAVGYFTDGQEVDVGDASVSVARFDRPCHVARGAAPDRRRHPDPPRHQRQLRPLVARSHPLQVATGELSRPGARRHRRPRHQRRFPPRRSNSPPSAAR